MSDFDDDFEGIAAANPDLSGDGPPTLNVMHGDTVVSVPLEEAEQVAVAVSRALWLGEDYQAAFVPAAGFAPAIQWMVADVAFQNTLAQVSAMHPDEGVALLRRMEGYVYWMAALKPEIVKGADDGR